MRSHFAELVLLGCLCALVDASQNVSAAGRPLDSHRGLQQDSTDEVCRDLTPNIGSLDPRSEDDFCGRKGYQFFDYDLEYGQGGKLCYRVELCVAMCVLAGRARTCPRSTLAWRVAARP